MSNELKDEIASEGKSFKLPIILLVILTMTFIIIAFYNMYS